MANSQIKSRKNIIAIYFAFFCFIAIIIRLNINKVKKDIYRVQINNQQKIEAALPFDSSLLNIKIKLSSPRENSFLSDKIAIEKIQVASGLNENDFSAFPVLSKPGTDKISGISGSVIPMDCAQAGKDSENQYLCLANFEKTNENSGFLLVTVSEISESASNLRIEIERKPGIKEKVKSLMFLFGYEKSH